MKSRSTKILILILVCNLAAIVGYYLLFQHIKTQSKTAVSLNSVIDLGQQKNSHLSSLRNTIKETDGKRQQLATLFLSSGEEVLFIEQIEILAKNSGLSAKTNNVSSAAGNVGEIKTLRVQLQTTGSWNNTLYFLSQVENLPYDIHAQGVSLTKQSTTDKNNSSSWVATFDISVTENS